jgi:hypothetical protein
MAVCPSGILNEPIRVFKDYKSARSYGDLLREWNQTVYIESVTVEVL